MLKVILELLAIAGAIYVGYYYRTKKESSLKKSVGMGCLGYFLLALIASMIVYATMSDQEKAELEAEQAKQDSIEAVQNAERKARELAEQAREAAEDKKFRAYTAARYYLIEHLRDPDSYKEEGYTCNSDEEQQIYTVNIKYRARNGFGGMNRTVTSFRVLVSDKEAIVIKTENLFH